jgi:glutathione S-transferase
LQKLFVSQDPALSSDCKLVRLVSKLLAAEERFQTVEVQKDDAKTIKKAITGRFPVLELQNGVVVCDSLPISRVLGKSHETFCGSCEGSRMQVDMWIDFINSSVVPAAQRVISQCNGASKEKMD